MYIHKIYMYLKKEIIKMMLTFSNSSQDIRKVLFNLRLSSAIFFLFFLKTEVQYSNKLLKEVKGKLMAF